MSDYDQRQYGLMLDRIEAFSSGQIYISTVLSDLESLMLAIPAPPRAPRLNHM